MHLIVIRLVQGEQLVLWPEDAGPAPVRSATGQLWRRWGTYGSGVRGSGSGFDLPGRYRDTPVVSRQPISSGAAFQVCEHHHHELNGFFRRASATSAEPLTSFLSVAMRS